MTTSMWRLVPGLAAGLMLVGTASPALADQLQAYVSSNTSFSQTSASAPSVPFGYFFVVGGQFATPGDFTSGSATYPGPGSPQSLSPDGTTQLQYESGYYASLGAMHAKYPFGTYSVMASGPGGTQTSTLSYTADHFTSDIPYLTNYTSLNGLDPSTPFTFYFPAFTANPATNEAWIFFTLYNHAGSILHSYGFLPTTTTSLTIPANQLLANTSYFFELNYDNRILDASSGTQLEFDMRTDGSLTTGALPVPEPGSLGLLAIGLFGLVFCRRWLPR